MLQFVAYVGVIIVCAVVAVLYLYPVSTAVRAVIRCAAAEDRIMQHNLMFTTLTVKGALVT